MTAAMASACASTTVPTTSTSPEATDQAPALNACEAVSLLAPDGAPVFLGGRWIGSGDPNALPAPSVFYVRQTNDCLVWVGLSAEDGEALGASWIETFSGRIRSDFTVNGGWENVPDGGRGTITIRIELVETADGYEAEMMLLESTGDSHRTERWVREATS